MLLLPKLSLKPFCKSGAPILHKKTALNVRAVFFVAIFPLFCGNGNVSVGASNRCNGAGLIPVDACGSNFVPLLRCTFESNGGEGTIFKYVGSKFCQCFRNDYCFKFCTTCKGSVSQFCNGRGKVDLCQTCASVKKTPANSRHRIGQSCRCKCGAAVEGACAYGSYAVGNYNTLKCRAFGKRFRTDRNYACRHGHSGKCGATVEGFVSNGGKSYGQCYGNKRGAVFKSGVTDRSYVRGNVQADKCRATGKSLVADRSYALRAKLTVLSLNNSGMQ